jgi:hypothetical protein
MQGSNSIHTHKTILTTTVRKSDTTLEYIVNIHGKGFGFAVTDAATVMYRHTFLATLYFSLQYILQKVARKVDACMLSFAQDGRT